MWRMGQVLVVISPLEKNGEVNSNGIRNNVNVVVGKEKEDDPQEDNKKLYGANGMI